MGTSLEKDYQELIALTKKYLAQEFKRDTLLTTPPETYAYFKGLAQKNKEQQVPQDVRAVPALKQADLPDSNAYRIEPLNEGQYKDNAFRMRSESTTQRVLQNKGQQAPLKQLEPKADNVPETPRPQIVHVSSSTLTPLQQLDIPNESQVKKATPSPAPTQGIAKTESMKPYLSPTFVLEPMKPAIKTDLSDIRQILETHFPQFSYLDPLKHEEAVVCIVAHDQIPEHLAFLQNVAKAINHLKAPTIIVPESKMYALPSSIRLCLSKYEELENRALTCLKIENISVYLNDPKQKAVLWQQIRLMVASLHASRN